MLAKPKKKRRVIYSLQPKQLLASNCIAIYRFFGGAKGGGKSYWLRSECTKQCMSAPGVNGLVLRRTYKEVYKNCIVPLMAELPRSLYKFNEQKGVMTFRNGSTITFGYCRNLKDVTQYQGIEYDFIGIEELTHWQYEWWQILMSCLRTVKPGITPNFFATGNPGDIGHIWVKRLWIDREYFPGEYPDQFEFIPSTIYDNKVLMDADPGYLRRLENLPPDEKKAFLYGDWNVFKGQYFKDYRADVHEIEPRTIPESWEKIYCLDYGYAKPSAVYGLAKDHDGNIYIFSEIYGPGFLYGTLLDEIIKYNIYNIELIVADPALKTKSFDTNESFFDRAEEKQFKVIPGTNDRVPGWNLLKEYLKATKEPELMKPKIYVFKTCFNFIRSFPTLIHDKTKVEDLNSDGEDHSADAVRYGLNYLALKGGKLSKYSEINQAGINKEGRVLGRTF